MKNKAPMPVKEKQEVKTFKEIYDICLAFAESNDRPFWQKQLCSELVHQARKIAEGMERGR